MSLFSELKRRNVFRVAIAYAVIAWFTIQAADIMLANFGAPVWVFKTVAGLLALGFPLALFLSWAYELTPAGIERAAPAASAEAAAPRAGPRIGSRYPRLPMLALALVALAAAWLTFMVTDSPRPDASGAADLARGGAASGTVQLVPLRVVRSDIALPKGLLLAHTFLPGIALSADGSMLAFAAGNPYSGAESGLASTFFRGALHIRRLDEPDAVPVTGAEDAREPAFSPDGSRIAYVRPNSFFSGQIETIAVTGGRATPLTEGEFEIAGLDWSDDGRIVFGTDQGLRSIPEGGGPAAELTATDPDGTEWLHAFPEALPGGRGILYTVVFEGREPAQIAVRMLDPASGESRELLTNASNARYTQGHLVFARDHTIHAVAFDLETQALRGEPRPLGMRVVQSHEGPASWNQNGAAQFAVSDTGDLAYAQGAIWPELPMSVAWVNREGEAEIIELEPGAYRAPRMDPAGRRILLSNFYRPNRMIRMHDIARGVTSVVRRGVGSWATWGPGPDDYTFRPDFSWNSGVGWATLGASAEPFMLDPPPGVSFFMTDGWSPDRRHLLGIAVEGSKPSDLVAWSEDEGWVKLTDTPDVWEGYPTFSPDGRWIAYTEAAEAFGGARVHVRPFRRDGPAIQVSMTNSSAPLWSPDGTELYYFSEVLVPAAGAEGARPGATETQRWIMAAPVTYSESGIEIGRPERLFRADAYANQSPIRGWDMGPDGRFLMVLQPSEEAMRSAIDEFFPNRIRLILNWASTLAERTP